MPKYRKKQTRLMSYAELKAGIADLPEDRQALLTLLFFSGCRISEALALTDQNITCTENTIFVEFYRLKGSKQTDPVHLPRVDALRWVCTQTGKLWPFSRTTGYRTVRKAFEQLYPHFFRMNRFTNVAEKHGLATMINFSGLAPTSVSHYIAKVDISTVGKDMWEEV